MTTLDDIAQLLGVPVRRRGLVADCVVCGYKLSLSATVKDEKLLVYCHACRDSAGIWQIIKNKNTGSSLAKPAKVAKQFPDHAAITLWSSSLLPQGTAVSEYLKGRGYEGPIPDDIRYLPSHKHCPSGNYFPVMIAAVRNRNGAVQGVHRTYLQPDGSGKAPVSPPKMSLGPLKGAAVRLAPSGSVLAISEGIETGLSVMQATELPVWAALSTSGMVSLELPGDVQEIILLADHDSPGLRAAKTAASRWARQGRHVKVICPPLQGQDFNDAIRGSR